MQDITNKRVHGLEKENISLREEVNRLRMKYENEFSSTNFK